MRLHRLVDRRLRCQSHFLLHLRVPGLNLLADGEELLALSDTLRAHALLGCKLLSLKLGSQLLILNFLDHILLTRLHSFLTSFLPSDSRRVLLPGRFLWSSLLLCTSLGCSLCRLGSRTSRGLLLLLHGFKACLGKLSSMLTDLVSGLILCSSLRLVCSSLWLSWLIRLGLHLLSCSCLCLCIVAVAQESIGSLRGNTSFLSHFLLFFDLRRGFGSCNILVRLFDSLYESHETVHIAFSLHLIVN